MTTNTKIIDMLNDLVDNNDILPVRVLIEHMSKGKKNNESGCPGALATAYVLGDPNMIDVTIRVGHRTLEHLSNRVVIKVHGHEYKYVGWIFIPLGNGGFHPKRFDEGKQKTPGSMILERWSRESIVPMTQETKDKLTSPNSRLKYKEYRSTLDHYGNYRVYTL